MTAPTASDGRDRAALAHVRELLSELYLDTDVEADREWRARELADSPFPIERIERILAEEVHPVCRGNLWTVIGAWAGFDPSWLEASIERRTRSPLRWLHRFDPGRRSALRDPEWLATRRRVLERRAGRARERLAPGPGSEDRPRPRRNRRTPFP